MDQSTATVPQLLVVLPTYGAIRGQSFCLDFRIQAIIVLCRRALAANRPLIYSVQPLRGGFRAPCDPAMQAFHVTAAASKLVIDAAHLGIEARRRRRYTQMGRRARHDLNSSGNG